MDILKAPKGTRDLDGVEVEQFQLLEKTAREAFRLFGFSEVRTPIFEQIELFQHSLGSTSDVVQKEMFSFVDRGERTFVLRPEGTAGVVRYFIENSLAVKGGTHRLFYIGPMFRAERPQAGRYRQFWQIGSEYFGSADAAADADTVLLMNQIIAGFGVKNISIQVNSIGCKVCRPKHRADLLVYLKTKESELTEESRQRMATNPMRVLDSKVDGPKVQGAPKITDYLYADCRNHYDLFLSLVKSAGLSVEENPRLVRGLDYYSRTVFEFISPDLGAQSAVAAGGRYDELVEHLGGPAVPAVGFALGMDRVVSARAAQKVAEAAVKKIDKKSAYVIPLSDEAGPYAFDVLQKLRRMGLSAPPVLIGKKLKNQMSHAVDSGANWAILIGEDELKASDVTVKNLESRSQEKVKLDALETWFKKSWQ